MPEISPASQTPGPHDIIPPSERDVPQAEGAVPAAARSGPHAPDLTRTGGTDPCGAGGLADGWRGVFLAALRETGNVSAAARRAGTCRSVCYGWRRRDRGFATAWADALEEAADRLEMEAFRRAVDGVGEDRFFGGHVVGEVTRYSDALLMFLLRARRPQRFGPRPESGSGMTGPDETENDERFLAMLRRRMEALAEDRGSGGD